MRIKLLLMALVVCLSSGAVAAPAITAASIRAVPFCRAVKREIIEETSCSGVVGQTVRKEVFLSAPAIASAVLVKPGDRVEQGETLALIDTGMTRTVLSNSVTVQKQAQDSALPKLEAGDWEAAASLYGVSMTELLPLMEKEDDLSSLTGVLPPAPVEEITVPSEILAPMSGIITDVSMDSGVLTQPSGAVFTVADKDHWAMTAQISESQIAGIQVGDMAIITLLALKDRTYQGVVCAISPTARRSEGLTSSVATVEVSVAILNADEKLKNDYSAEAVILSQQAKNLCTLPYEAVLQDENNQEYVFVLNEGRAQRRPIQTGQELLSCVEVVSGVCVSDAVLIPNGALTDGERVRLLEGGAW